MFFGLFLLLVFIFAIEWLLAGVAAIFGESHSIYKFLEGDVNSAFSGNRWESRGSVVFVISALLAGIFTKLYLKKFPYTEPTTQQKKILTMIMLIAAVALIVLPVYLAIKDANL